MNLEARENAQRKNKNRGFLADVKLPCYRFDGSARRRRGEGAFSRDERYHDHGAPGTGRMHSLLNSNVPAHRVIVHLLETHATKSVETAARWGKIC
jgi:hypothetical protein